MNSIYHFFKAIYLHREVLSASNILEEFPFQRNLLSCINRKTFPNLAIKINKNGNMFSGGELIGLKDSNSYTVSSFNSTVPVGSADISKIIESRSNNIKNQMEKAGDDILSLLTRDVFYLVRGKKSGSVKVVLMHGSFLETIGVRYLLRNYFSQVLAKNIKQSRLTILPAVQNIILDFLSEQENFSRVREVEKASVKLRFRIMTEVKAEGNILNSQQYPSILDNTLNFILPKHDQSDQTLTESKMKEVFSGKELKTFKAFDIKHHFNGYFRVYQTAINSSAKNE
ncbi:MAG: hypothetical protein M1480_08530 [Bacteroidetes bacterium]|nr:hypothetical protein [Bacteroidota bacterium]